MGLETLGVRTIVSLIFGPAILFSAWMGGYTFLSLVTLISILAMHEFYNLAAHKNTHPQRIIGIVTGAGLCLMLYFGFVQTIWVLFTTTFVLLLVVEVFRNQGSAVLNVSTTLTGIFLVPLMLGFLILIREIPNPIGYRLGGYLIILIFVVIWICDSAAYILGSRFGKNKLFERVSPNKTIEGAIFGVLFALLAAYLCWATFLSDMDLLDILIIAGICGTLGQLSDLVESLLKRDAGVKDTSQIIPGHGGVLDRFDSELLVAPVVYLYLQFLVF